MKKIFTLILLAAVAVCANAELKMYFGDTEVTNGGSYKIGYKLEIVSSVYSYKQLANLSVVGPKNTAGTVTVTSNNTRVGVCSFDGQCVNCQASNSYTVTKNGTFTGNKDDLMIELITNRFNATVPTLDNIVVNVTVKCGSESISVTVNMTNEEEPETGSVGNLPADADMITLVGTTLNYQASKPGKIEVFNLLGVKVISEEVSGKGTISLATMEKGIYVCRMGRYKTKIRLQ